MTFASSSLEERQTCRWLFVVTTLAYGAPRSVYFCMTVNAVIFFGQERWRTMGFSHDSLDGH